MQSTIVVNLEGRQALKSQKERFSDKNSSYDQKVIATLRWPDKELSFRGGLTKKGRPSF